jgi:hypothetical protein
MTCEHIRYLVFSASMNMGPKRGTCVVVPVNNEVHNSMEMSPSWEVVNCAATREFTTFTRALHWSLSWARSVQPIPPHPISLRSILILSSRLRLDLPSGVSFLLAFPPKSYMHWWSTKPWKYIGERRYSSAHSELRHWLEANGHCDAPAALRPAPIEQKAGWATEPVWTLWGRKSFLILSGIV